ncbi:hypothetical protein H5410_039362 [Solanum commersonii]|uniref:Uncharacterized protein n=1 Tax=Solanum commersonii TaxID=4109 RepID=A0A9J5YD62_SOLCO|nr:hypothetical protein H5410_039362 [Solanum commersonii]
MRMKALVFCRPNSGITHLTFYRNGDDRKGDLRHRRHLKARALREYEQAVEDKDLSRALRYLREDSSIGKLDWSPIERDWQVLDTCLNADDMRLVGSAYAFLKDRGLLPNFAKYNTIGKKTTQTILNRPWKSSFGRATGCHTNRLKVFNWFRCSVTKLSPKKWGLSGTSSVLLATSFAGVTFLLNQGIDIRPNIAAVLGLAMLDAILLGGSCLAQISSFWPPYKRRICVHEAGHLLVGKPRFCKHLMNLLQ